MAIVPHFLKRNGHVLLNTLFVNFVIAIAKKVKKISFFQDLCKHFSNFPRSQEACQFIFIDQVLSDKLKVPQYNRIIHKLETALGEVKKTTGQTEFEWIKSPPSEAKQLKFGEK